MPDGGSKPASLTTIVDRVEGALLNRRRYLDITLASPTAFTGGGQFVTLPGFGVVLNTTPIIKGTDATDSATINPTAGFGLQIWLNSNPAVTLSGPLADFTFNGRGEDDLFTVQLNGLALATGGVLATDLNGGSIEQAFGSAWNDDLVGDVERNVIMGRAGDVSLRGMTADDTLFGMAGDDTMSADEQSNAVLLVPKGDTSDCPRRG